jgi:hypothetical protein
MAKQIHPLRIAINGVNRDCVNAVADRHQRILVDGEGLGQTPAHLYRIPT